MPSWQKAECSECGKATWVLSIAAAAPMMDMDSIATAAAKDQPAPAAEDVHNRTSSVTDRAGSAKAKVYPPVPAVPDPSKKRQPSGGQAWFALTACRQCQKASCSGADSTASTDSNRARCACCGRIFLAERIARHSAACKKANRSRPIFRSSQQRVYQEGGTSGRVVAHGQDAESSAQIQARVKAARDLRKLRSLSRQQDESSEVRSSAVSRMPAETERDPGCPLTRAEIRRLQTRALTPEDYELLLRLDESITKPTLKLTDCDQFLAEAAADGDWIGETCSICLVEMTGEGSQDVSALKVCGHTFHASCVRSWLSESKASCPLCQQAVEGQDVAAEC
eukprot:CAMPEP_0178414318 /NCGR_PEP_ID=MMETSP0689_2-20121128/22975_1 /TAXON_ID=160604 /ORGANISM="Amphidinium massartii, Strain CS-259" /LENGTH=337 /DNA_ID=CAMNT_0020035605 /DNA_START=96 /DNA_END=1109 /DNA_ORIENTATION=-